MSKEITLAQLVRAVWGDEGTTYLAYEMSKQCSDDQIDALIAKLGKQTTKASVNTTKEKK